MMGMVVSKKNYAVSPTTPVKKKEKASSNSCFITPFHGKLVVNYGTPCNALQSTSYVGLSASHSFLMSLTPLLFGSIAFQEVIEHKQLERSAKFLCSFLLSFLYLVQ